VWQVFSFVFPLANVEDKYLLKAFLPVALLVLVILFAPPLYLLMFFLVSFRNSESQEKRPAIGSKYFCWAFSLFV
jgi:hypothetical protein